MLQGASLEFIEEHRDTFGYDHLFHAHLLKRVNNELYMMYGEIQLRLPNPELALYSVRTFHVDLQAQPVNARASRGTASERITRCQELVWRGADPGQEQPAHASYDSWMHHNYRVINLWEYPPTHQPKERSYFQVRSIVELDFHLFISTSFIPYHFSHHIKPHMHILI